MAVPPRVVDLGISANQGLSLWDTFSDAEKASYNAYTPLAKAKPTGLNSGGLSFNQQMALRSAGGGSSGPRQVGTQITEFGRGDFNAALVDWNRVYTDAQQGIPAAQRLIEQFAPGGEFGAGRRQEARELIGQGLARDTASAVASGSSSISSARGLSTLAGRELATQFGNIEDARAQLQIQAFSPYTQMLSNLASIGTARPTAGQFISRITTPDFKRSGTTVKKAS